MKAIYAGNILFHNFNIKDKKWETKSLRIITNLIN